MAKDYSLHPSRANTQFCQAVSKGQMVSLSKAEGAVRKALPLVMYHTGEDVTKIPFRALMFTVCYLLLKTFTRCQKDAWSVLELEKLMHHKHFKKTEFIYFIYKVTDSWLYDLAFWWRDGYL